MAHPLKHKITLIFGRICAGKAYHIGDRNKIVVSDIVKEIVKASDRSALQNSMQFDIEIADKLIHEIVLDYGVRHNQEVFVDGIRQVSILERVLQVFPEAELVWIEAPVEVRKARYESRKDIKDTISFEEADNKPIELECQEIYNIFKENLTIINNY